MSIESQQRYPLSRREKIGFAGAGLIFEAMGIGAVLDGTAAGAALMGLGLGTLVVAKWGEFRSEDSARTFDILTATHRDGSGTPL